MEHGKKHRKLSRTNKKRAALLVHLAQALIAHNKITTTQAKAKSLRVYIEKLISKSRRDSIPTRRLITARLGSHSAHKLINDIAPRFKDQTGGYTRITQLPPRMSDGSAMAMIEFIQ